MVLLLSWLRPRAQARGRGRIGHTWRQLGGQPSRQRRVHGARLLLRHPVPRRHDHLGEVPAVAPHGLGQPGIDGLARVVVLAVQEQDGQAERAAVLRPRRVGQVALRVHVPGVRAEEAVAREAGRVGVELLRGHHVGIHRHVGRPAGAAEPAAVLAGLRGARRLALAARAPLPEQGLDHVARIGVERRRRPSRSSPRRRACSPTAPPGTAPPDRPRDPRAGSGCAGRTPPRDTARRGWPRPSSAPGGGSPGSTPPGCPSRGRPRPPSPGRARRAARACRAPRARARSPRGARRRWSGRSRACPARSRGTRGRRSTGADAARRATAPASRARTR